MEDQLDKYLNETTAEDISTDDLLNWFENNQSNSNNQFNNTETMGFNNQKIFQMDNRGKQRITKACLHNKCHTPKIPFIDPQVDTI